MKQKSYLYDEDFYKDNLTIKTLIEATFIEGQKIYDILISDPY